MDRIIKFLRKLSGGDRKAAETAISRILADDLHGLDIKKLRGRRDSFRVRVRSLRIVFSNTNGEIRIISVGNRNDNTYNEF